MPPFERSIFLNCPFDDDYAPILQAVCFCVVYLDFHPRLAPENSDNAAGRLDRILDLVRGSKFAIHDLSRCTADTVGEYVRMNMPFELGIDHACRRFGTGELQDKAILILEHARYDSQKALSDIAGWDIQAHGQDYQRAVRRVRDWLVDRAGASAVGTSRILGAYDLFQEWHWNREIDRGADEDDIREYPTNLILKAMHEWREQLRG